MTEIIPINEKAENERLRLQQPEDANKQAKQTRLLIEQLKK